MDFNRNRRSSILQLRAIVDVKEKNGHVLCSRVLCRINSLKKSSEKKSNMSKNVCIKLTMEP
jgi:hypothetical protein